MSLNIEVISFFTLSIALLLSGSTSEGIPGQDYLQPICSLELVGANSSKQEILYTVNLTYSDKQNGVCPLEKSPANDFSKFVKCERGTIYIESGFAGCKRKDFFDKVCITCASFQPVKYGQDVELPYAGMDIIFSKKILPENRLLHKVSTKFPKTLGVAGEDLSVYSGTYKFWSESSNWSIPITLNITTTPDSPFKSVNAARVGKNLKVPIVTLSDNFAVCHSTELRGYVYFVNIGGANNPTEATLLKDCLNKTTINSCGNKYAGTNCNLDRHCKKISPIHQNGMLRCSIGDVSTDIIYFRDIHAEIQQNMVELWDASLVIKIEKDNGLDELELPFEEVDDEEINNVTHSGASTEFLTKPEIISLYDMQVARFECHFIHYVLVPPVVWYIDWSNGTTARHFVDYGDNITDEIRYVTNELHQNKEERIKVAIKSSHLEFQANTEMVSIKCQMWYWDSERSAVNVQRLDVKASKQPMFDDGPTKHTVSGETLKLQCLERHAIPQPHYKWEFNGRTLLGNGTRVWNNQSERFASVLEISKVGESDSGEYACIAYNFRGAARKIFEVTVDDSVRKLWLALSITSVFLIFFLVVALAGMYKLHLKQRARLTKLEIKEFLSGDVKKVKTNDYVHVKVKYMAYDKKFEIPWNKFQLGTQVLGKGVHGIVYKGILGNDVIAVKTVREGATKDVLKALLDELKIMIYLGNHDYIVDLRGACTEFLHQGRAYVFVEFCPLGSIESFLRNNRQNFCADFHNNDYMNGCGVNRGDVDLAPQFNRKDLIQWSIQIVKGMQFLEEKKVIHGDLATRNILMKSMYHIKITDFGLSRQLINTETYVKKHQSLLPWRHMSLEALRDFTFTSKSDVWSYGVTLWEIFTLGTTPYPGMNWKPEFLQLLENDLRLYKPKYATKAMYKILTDCWAPEPESRPSFQQLEMQFSDSMAHL